MRKVFSFFIICLMLATSASPMHVFADDIVYIQNSYTSGGYLYDSGEELKYGYPLQGDASFQWRVADGRIQNVLSGRYVTMTGHGTGESSFGDPVKLTEVADENSIWQFELVTGGASTNIFSNADGYEGFALHLEGVINDYVRAQRILAEQSTWGNMRWRFLKETEMNFDAILRAIAELEGTAGSFVLPDRAYNLKNSWFGLYMLEHDGVPVYGNVDPQDKNAQWRMRYDEESGLTALVNEGTGHSVISGSKGLQCVDSIEYYWNLTPNRNDLYPNAVEFEDGKSPKSFLHMETMNGKIENSSAVQSNWGTPHWEAIEPENNLMNDDKILELVPEGYVRLLSAEQDGWALYANSAGNALYGELNEKDARGHWEFVINDSNSYMLKNREFGTFLCNAGGNSLRLYEQSKASNGTWMLWGDDDDMALQNVAANVQEFQYPFLTFNENRNTAGVTLVTPDTKTARWRTEPAPQSSVTQEGEEADMTLLNKLLKEAESGRGAPVNYVRYEAERCETNAEALYYSTEYHTVQSEASGRSAVELSQTTEYVRLTLTKPCNAIVVRYCVPDSEDGKGGDYTLSLLAGNELIASVPMSSRQTWNYGVYPWTNNPSDGNPHNFFDEVRIILPETYPAGTVLRLQKGVRDYADSYVIDLIETEVIPPPVQMPENALLLTDFGNNAGALEMCIGEASMKGVPVYIPPGTYEIDHKHTLGKPITIVGAGMWYTTLKNASFYVRGDDVSISGISLDGYANTRRDAIDPAAFESDGVANLMLKDIWITHYKVGVWLNGASGAELNGLRIRNTFADGINFHSGVTDSVIRNCDLRSTGDDAIGLWSERITNSNIRIYNNNIALPWLANCIGIYGGGDITISDNWICDTVYAGAGINVSTNFKPAPPSGIIAIARNTIERCGSESNGNDIGAIWFNTVAGYDNNAAVEVTRNIILDSPHAGISFENGGNLANVGITENVIRDTGTYGMEIGSTARGTVGVFGNLIVGTTMGDVQNKAGGFTIKELDKALKPPASPRSQNNGRSVMVGIVIIIAVVVAVAAIVTLIIRARRKNKLYDGSNTEK